MSDALTPEQVENWRKILFRMFGPYALFMPAEQIQVVRDRLQANIDSLSTKEPTMPKFCDCDPKKHGVTIRKSGMVECNKCHRKRRQEGVS